MAEHKVNPKPGKKPGPKRAVSKQRSAGGGADCVYQVKITLNGIKPPIWRRVQVLDDSLADLHNVIQTCMGWEDYHLHVFVIGGQHYGLPDQWQDPDIGDSRKVKLSHLVAQDVKKFRYTYDMGDTWEHTIVIEKTVPAEAGVQYPHCIAGQRACPPEDCGGPWTYADFLEAIQNPQHPRHQDRIEWIGGEFDAEAFDLKTVNAKLH
jgi:hypothetical protein